MYSAQRILLAIGCLICMCLLKYLVDESRSASNPKNTALRSTRYSAIHRNAQSAAKENEAFRNDERNDTRSPDSLPGAADVVVVLKTGSTEIYDKLPIHLRTTFTSLRNHLVYSDFEQQFGAIRTVDALAMVSQHVRETNPDLEHYRLLRSHINLGADASELKGEKSWGLDKWKFLPMVSDAYARFHGTRSKKWFVFIEADTYISSHNLLLWLAQLNADQPIYAGSQVLIGDVEFAHGGSGLLLSAQAAKALSESYLTRQEFWEERLLRDCCGDKVLSEVLQSSSARVNLTRAFPMIQGEMLDSLDWSETHWCMPAITWHHMSAASIDKLWQFERSWRETKGVSTPILFKEYFEALVLPRMHAANWTMVAWDNLSSDWDSLKNQEAMSSDKDPFPSEVSCETWCKGEDQCIQWAWTPGRCRGNRVIRLGWAITNRPSLGSADDRIVKPEGDDLERAVSGWIRSRVERFMNDHRDCQGSDNNKDA